MRASTQPWRGGDGGVRVLVRVTPKSAQDGVDGTVETREGPAFRVRVRAVAEDGRANRAVEAVVADWLGIAKGSVKVASGAKSRIKTLLIDAEPARLGPVLQARLGALG